jgi:hypothetical protein
MARRARSWGRVVAAGLLVVAWAGSAAAQTPAASPAKAKELAAVMKARQIEAFAMRETPAGNRFIAVMLVPDVQMLVVSAAYTRPTDIEYWMYQKDYVTAYRDLAGGALAQDRFFVEDVLGDGLVATPAKNTPPDAVTVADSQQLLEGPADPKKRNDKRMRADEYAKAFADADARYAKLLDGLIAELKKGGALAPAGVVR